MSNQEKLKEINIDGGINGLKFSPNGRFLTVLSRSPCIYMWEVCDKDLRLLWRRPSRLTAKQLNLQSAEIDQENEKLLKQLEVDRIW